MGLLDGKQKAPLRWPKVFVTDKAYFLVYHLLLETQTNARMNTHFSFGGVTLSDPRHSYLEGGEILTPQYKSFWIKLIYTLNS